MFPSRLKSLRREKDLTQKDLASILHLQNTAISKYELGERKPDQDILIKISNYFDVSVDYLLGQTDIRNTKVKIDDDKEVDVCNYEFENPEEAFKFILQQPAIAAYGGYNFEQMSDEEILEIANDILLTLRISIERRKNKTNKQ